MRKILMSVAAIFLAAGSFANNIQVSNVTMLPSTNQIQFDISWDNSWRSDLLKNWDAAWVFIKYKDINGYWNHIHFTDQDNLVPPGFTYHIPIDKKGAMLYRSVAGSGTSSLTGVKLGIPSSLATGVYDIRVFAIEMVYIPSGPFWVGDFSTSSNAYSFLNLPPYVNSSNPVLGDLLWTGTNLNFTNGYPTGIDSFYCMKYELTQGAYRDFLNCLTYNQQVSRTAVAPSSATGTAALGSGANGRPYIEIATPGAVASQVPAVYGCDANNNNIYNEAADGEWVACTYLNWVDKAAYLWWACLSPMTELQFEKICRGPQQPVPGEYAWGTPQVYGSAYTLGSPSTSGEIVTNPAVNPSEGNAVYSLTYTDKPLRNGIFATGTSNRISSGGSFYGVMEMSGNVWETVVTTANDEGRGFGKNNGFGYLTSNGNISYGGNYNWPGSYDTGGGVYFIDGTVPAKGLIYRGGSMAFPAAEMRVSNRTAGYVVDNSPETIRYYDQGCRGVRNL